MLSIKVLGDYINGCFERPQNADFKITSRDPGDLGYRIGSFPVYSQHIDKACAAARNAFSKWRNLGHESRVDYLRKFAAELVNRREELKELIATETGKPLWEAEEEVASVVLRVECEVRDGTQSISSFDVKEIRWGVRGICRFVPLGVVVVLGSSISPMDISCGHILPALLAGNTVVFKPCSLVPALGQFLACVIDEIELPAGVFNLIQGDATIDPLLVSNTNVNGVLFSGSYDTGSEILKTIVSEPYQLIALEISGVNTAIVTRSADCKRAVYECVKGSFLSAGQRFTSTRVILVAKDIFSGFVDVFVETVKALKVGYAFDPQVFMGPLQSESALMRALDRQEQLEKIGGHHVLFSKELKLNRQGYYLSPSIYILKHPLKINSFLPRDRLLCPSVVIMPYTDDEQGITLANSTQGALCASVFTEDINYFDLWTKYLCYGQINFNLATTETSARLPFTGLGFSSNHRSFGAFTQRTCTYPLSMLQNTHEYDPARNISNFPNITDFSMD